MKKLIFLFLTLSVFLFGCGNAAEKKSEKAVVQPAPPAPKPKVYVIKVGFKDGKVDTITTPPSYRMPDISWDALHYYDATGDAHTVAQDVKFISIIQ